MILHRLCIENFQVFDGKFDLEFPSPQAGRPFVFVFGENFHGKTTLVNAIRWALLGRTSIEAEKDVNRWAYVNHNRNSASVRLDCGNRGDTYVIERHMAVSGSKPHRQVLSDTFNVRKNGKELSRVEAATELRRVFPERLANFYLFDGEKLSSYEKDLRGVSERVGRRRTTVGPSNHIRDDIERLMGLPALQLTADDLTLMVREAERAYSAKLSSTANKNRDSAKATLLNDSIEQLETNLHQLTSELAESNNRLAELDLQRKQTDEIRSLLTEKDTLKDQLKDLDDRQERLLKERSEGSITVWRYACLPIAKHIFGEDSASIEALQKHVIQRQRLIADIQTLEAAKNQRVCPTCRQSLTDAKSTSMDSQIASLRECLSKLPQVGVDDLDALQLRRSKVASLIKAAENESRILQVDSELSSIRRQHQRIAVRLTEIGRQIDQDSSAVDAKEVFLEYTAEARANGELDASVKRLSQDLAVKREEYAAVQKRLRNLPEVDAEDKQLQTLNALRNVFSKSIDVERSNLRERLSKESSPLFVALTGGKDSIWGGLYVDDQFVVRTLDKNGDDKEFEASAGEAQLVALSIIGGLHRLANAAAHESSSLVLDTPLSRLDEERRLSVLSALSGWSDQVLLLVHSGELRIEQARNTVGNLIDATYRIERIDTYASRLQRIE